MKIVTKRVASILLIAILALSFVTLPAHAAITITSVTPGNGDKGDTIEVKGSGVQGGRTVNLYWDLVQDWSAADGAGLLNSSKAKASGAWEVWFDVPEATNGTHYIYIEDSYTLDWESEFFYVYPKVSLSSTSGLANDPVDVDGYGFSEDADVAIIFHDVSIDTGSDSEANVIVGDDVETEFEGSFAETPVIPTSVVFSGTGTTITDDGKGGLEGPSGFSGSINYINGDWEVEWTTAPSNTTVYSAAWLYAKDVTNDLKVLSTVPNTNDFGSFSKEVDVPNFIPEGLYHITVMDEYGVAQTKDFTIGPVITLTPDSGPVGDVVTVDGRGFTTDDYIMTITLDGVDCYLVTNSSVSTKNKFRIEFIVPDVGKVGEDSTLQVWDDHGKTATADFEIEGKPYIEIDPASAALGDEISISGGNFSAVDGEIVELWLYDSTGMTQVDSFDVEDTETDSNGEFSGIYSVPPVPNDEYLIIAMQPEFNIDAEEDFTVGLIFVVIKPTSGTAGEDVHISGVGFQRDHTFGWNATFSDIAVLEDKPVDAQGVLQQGTFYVPTVDPGTYTITVMGIESENYVEIDFEVTDTTAFSFDPEVVPVGEDKFFTVNITGEAWLFIDGEPVDFIMYNVTEDGEIEEEWDFTSDVINGFSDEDGEIDAWFDFFYSDDVSPGEYFVNATQTGPNEEELYAQTTITVVPESYSITPRKSSFAISDNVAFNIINSFKLDGAYMEIYDPNGDLYWLMDEIEADDWVRVGTAHQVPYYAQTSNENSLLLDPDAPIGEWFWVFYEVVNGDEEELVNGTFTVGEAAEDILGRMIEELAGDLTQLSEDFAGISTDVSALATDVQALAGSVSDAIAAANAATSAVQQVASAVADVADVAASAAAAAEQAATAASAAQEAANDAGRSASGLTTLVYGAIGASLIAALAAIVSLMQISRRIAG